MRRIPPWDAISSATPVTASARYPEATLRSSLVIRSRSTRSWGSQCSTHAPWNHAPTRLRRWDSPTTLRPVTVTSPAPTPPKQIKDDHRVRSTGRPDCTSTPASPICFNAEPHVAPSQSNALVTSASHSGSPLGTQTSIHTGSSGVTSTAPPPDRRCTTSMPHFAAKRRSTTAGDWVDPSTTAERVGWQTATARSSGPSATDGHASCSSAADPLRSSIRQ